MRTLYPSLQIRLVSPVRSNDLHQHVDTAIVVICFKWTHHIRMPTYSAITQSVGVVSVCMLQSLSHSCRLCIGYAVALSLSESLAA